MLDYTFAVSQQLWLLRNDIHDIESYCDEIVRAITDEAHEILPVMKLKKHIKPYWNNYLTNLLKTWCSFANLDYRGTT